MKIRVRFDGTVKTGVRYIIRPPQGVGSVGHPQTKRLFSLMPTIRAMAKRELGTDFVKLRKGPNECPWIELITKHGFTRGENKFALRAVIGWIELFDTVR